MSSFGSNFGKRYRLLQEGKPKGTNIGTQIFICEDLLYSEILAIKTINAKHIKDIRIEKALIKEALVYYLIGNHPHIVNGKYFNIIDNQPYIALEYIPFDEKKKNSLKNHFNKALTMDDILKWSIHICFAMEYMLNRGILAHRDLKPSNILITPNKILKISDFSLAMLDMKNIFVNALLKLIYERKPELEPLIESVQEKIVGSINWMAPEQFKGKADVRSDIYSFGLILYQMCNQGKLPFSDLSLKRYVLLNKSNLEEMENKTLLAIIKKCLEKKPNNRFQDFTELKKELLNINENSLNNLKISPPKGDRYLTLENISGFFKSL